MLSYPDFSEKQLVFITTEWGRESKLSILNRNIVYKQDGEVVVKVSLYKIHILFIMGDITLTTQFIKYCQEYGVSIVLLKYNFGVLSEIISQAEGNYLLRYRQYTIQEEQSFQDAKVLVIHKILNQRKLIKSLNQDLVTPDWDISVIKKKVHQVDTRYQLMGVEGEYAKKYFWSYFKDIGWIRRAPRTKYDIPNLLMDIGYTYLFNFVEALLRVHGFDTYKGFYHQLFFARKSLACDLMEPLRPIIDREIRKIYTLNRINLKDFKVRHGVYEIPWNKSKKYNQIFLEALMHNKEEIFGYIRSYYRYMMKHPDYSLFPRYTIKTRI